MLVITPVFVTDDDLRLAIVVTVRVSSSGVEDFETPLSVVDTLTGAMSAPELLGGVKSGSAGDRFAPFAGLLAKKSRLDSVDGELNGEVLGAILGVKDGNFDGVIDGANDGNELGDSVEDTEGDHDGLRDGFAIGIGLGRIEGDSDGDVDGPAVSVTLVVR